MALGNERTKERESERERERERNHTSESFNFVPAILILRLIGS